MTVTAATATGVPTVTEKAFLAQVLRLARLAGWLCFHPYDSRKSCAGFPDLTLVRESLIFAELKSDTGKVTAEQQHWLDRLKAAGAEAHLWRPRDWEEIQARLLGGRRAGGA